MADDLTLPYGGQQEADAQELDYSPGLEAGYAEPYSLNDVLNDELDTRLRLATWLPLALLWTILLLIDWKGPQLYLVIPFSLCLVVALLVHPVNIPLVVIMGYYAPLELGFWRPYVMVFIVAVFCAFIRNYGGRMVRSSWHKLSVVAALFTLYQFASIVLASNAELGLDFAMRYLQGWMLLVVLLAFLDSRRMTVGVLKGVAILAGMALLIGVIFYLNRNGMWLTEVYNVLREKTAEKFRLEAGFGDTGRLIWAGTEPNYWAGQLLFPLGLAIGLMGASRKTGSRMFWLAVGIAILVGILGTYSRSGFVSLVLMGLFLLARRRGRAMIPIAALTVAFFVALAVIPQLRERYLGIQENLQVQGGSGRFMLWAAGINLWLGSPLLGNGPGSFSATTGRAIHNAYIQVATDGGIIALGLYLVLIGMGLTAWVRVSKLAKAMGNRRLQWLAEGCLAGMVGMLLQMGTISAEDPRTLWMAIAFGVQLWLSLRRDVSYEQQVAQYEAAPAA